MNSNMDRNIWKINEFKDCGVGKKRLFAIIKHFFRCIKWSWQRIIYGYCNRDIWDMYGYLQSLLPDMLQYLKDTRMGSPGFLGENYTDEHGVLVNDTCHEEWDRILDKMIYLWHESNEATCSQKNEFEEEYMMAFEEFNDTYGVFGERLSNEDPQGTNVRCVHFMDELDEYKDISDKYLAREKELEKYREGCKDQALELLKEYFFCLWD